MIRRICTRLRSFRACVSGSIAIEFVLVVPILVGILMGSSELTRYLRAREHLQDYAAMVAYDIAGAAAPVTAETLSEMIQRIGLVAPELIDPSQTAWSANSGAYLAVGITMVAMSPASSTCTSMWAGCAYRGDVAWSFGNNKRSCAQLMRAYGSTPNASFNLPSGAFQPNPVVVVDVKATYKPLFANGFNLSAFGNTTHVNLPIDASLSTFSWQSVRNWRGTDTSSYPGLASTSAGVWTGTICPGVA